MSEKPAIDDLTQAARALFNQICIAWTGTTGRVVGIHRDAMDAYYILRLRGRDVQAKGLEYARVTMVTGCDSLVVLPGYQHIDADFTREDCPPVETFLETHATRLENIQIYGFSAVDGGLGWDDRIVLNPEPSTFGPPTLFRWLLIRRAGRDNRGIVGLEVHDEKGGRALSVENGMTWQSLLASTIEAELADG